MSFFVGDLVEVAKEHRTGKKDSEGGRAYIQAINNDIEAINNDDDDRGTKRPRYGNTNSNAKQTRRISSAT